MSIKKEYDNLYGKIKDEINDIIKYLLNNYRLEYDTHDKEKKEEVLTYVYEHYALILKAYFNIFKQGKLYQEIHSKRKDVFRIGNLYPNNEIITDITQGGYCYANLEDSLINGKYKYAIYNAYNTAYFSIDGLNWEKSNSHFSAPEQITMDFGNLKIYSMGIKPIMVLTTIEDEKELDLILKYNLHFVVESYAYRSVVSLIRDLLNVFEKMIYRSKVGDTKTQCEYFVLEMFFRNIEGILAYTVAVNTNSYNLFDLEYLVVKKNYLKELQWNIYDIRNCVDIPNKWKIY